MNIVFVVIDTLRQDHLGAYDNPWISTPSLDAFAGRAVRYTRAYPESLPTLCARRALHTGIRTFPYEGHREYKGDFPGVAPGWGPIPEEQETIAELLQAQGYRTALISDTYHMFKPSKNFHRGFDQWSWIRGQEGDRFRSGPSLDPARLDRHLPSKLRDNPAVRRFLTSYLVNTTDIRSEEQTFPAQVFGQASHWLRQNADADRFFLVVDCFDPHEPWDPPADDRRRYDPDDEDVVDVIQSMYGWWDGLLTPRELKRLQANYAGEVTLVDRWFGRLIETLEQTGRLDDTVVVVMSDHGHNLGYAPRDKGLVSKQGHPMTRSVADLVLMISDPTGVGAGTTCDALLYNIDAVETMLAVAGVDAGPGRDGRVVWQSDANARDAVTIGWGPLVTVITDDWWYNADIWGGGAALHDLRADPDLTTNLADQQPETCRKLLEVAVRDAGGHVPDTFLALHGQPGCTPFEDISVHWQGGMRVAEG